MALGVATEGLPLLLAGGGMLVVALAVLAIDFSARVNRAFATFLVLRGGVNVLTALRLTDGSDGLAFAILPYFALGVLPATIWFFLVYRPGARPSFTRGIALAGLLVATTVIEVAFALDHDLYRSAGATAGYGPLYVFVGLSHLGYALVAWGLVREHIRAPVGGRRSALLLSAVGFALDPLFLALNHIVTYDIAGRWPPGDGLWFRINHWIEPIALVPLALVALALAGAARRGPDDASRRHARRALVAFALPILCALSLLAIAARGQATTSDAVYNALDGLWALSLPMLVGYGLAKRQLFDIDVKLRWTVSRGALVVAFAVAFVVTSRVAEVALAPSLGPWIGIVSVAVLLFAIIPLVGLGERFAGALLPGVDRKEILNERKLEVYRAALESALAENGTIIPEQERILASLRTRLGITDRDHAVLAYAVRGLAAPAPEEQAGGVVMGRYRLTRLLGEGGQGRTWLADDATLSRQVVVKILRPGLADAAALREARAIASIHHPNVVTLFDVERVGDRVVLVMEHVPGGSLSARVDRGGPVRGGEFLKLATGLLDALHSVHEAGGLHRDVKPSNVLLTAGGDAKLADFGVARVPGVETTVGAFEDGHASGTVRYMSPEQARGKTLGAASDVFSAAATLWEAWSGRPYLEARAGESTAELRMRAAGARAFDRDDAPPEYAEWFRRALDPAPERRFASAKAAREALASQKGIQSAA